MAWAMEYCARLRVARAMRAERGSVLAFLPGAAEIRRTQNLLESRADEATDIVPLYGALGVPNTVVKPQHTWTPSDSD